MQVLEKILEEIELEKKRLVFYPDCSSAFSAVQISTIEKIEQIIYKYMSIRKQMNDGWIPVEKDLPKNGSEVWVVLESTYGTGYRTYSNARYLYFENCGESHWCDNHYGYLEWDKYSDGNGGSSQYKVIAWQSIAPYRPERSDNHDGE